VSTPKRILVHLAAASKAARRLAFACSPGRCSHARIGQGVCLLPFDYNPPIRAAERAATLDIVSGGRLEFGTGRSATLVETEPFGVAPSSTAVSGTSQCA